VFNVEWHVQYSLVSDAVELWAMRRTDDGRKHITAELTLHDATPRGELFDGGPTLRLTSDEAQQLMNGLWHAGIRPRDGAGSLAHVDATKAHLEDMRRLVFEQKPSSI
jgi:hypothetical protein